MKLSNCVSGLLAMASAASAASLQQVTNFGANTSGARMFIYVPDRLSAKPPVIVAIHYCTGTAQAYFSGSPYARLADRHGFIVIYPESPYSGGCWDVSSPATLAHNGGANSNSIANMVTWTLSQYSADASRVFVTGTSSGAMMTNVLAATYPNLFKAASAYAGVPAGCFYTGTTAGWNSTCANGQSIHSQDVWAQTALKMYPGYTGPRPKMLIIHGSADDIIYPQNFNETMKQWAGVFGYTYGSPQQTLPNNPAAPYTKYVYGPNLVGVYGSGVTHNVPINGEQDLAWFGITGGDAPVTTSSTTLATTTRTASTTSTASPVTTIAPGCTPVARWGQCGGQGFNGCTICVAPYTCKFSNNWYSQCL
ncbi:putative acetylxylan esterase A [Podospora aff. communis PSN243]|uniref:Carboxylic ester hydrolase n=1 Tax=Podospora aff. communis PSN243 TaxID=3040156 RepID=A0AAV9GUP1_9PEZI|nr:putative acetylxylan esterase A [Podospora aff. communis PSN243]